MVKALEEIRDSQAPSQDPAPTATSLDSKGNHEALTVNRSPEGARNEEKQRGEEESPHELIHNGQVIARSTSCSSEPQLLVSGESPGAWLAEPLPSGEDVHWESSPENHMPADDELPGQRTPVREQTACKCPNDVDMENADDNLSSIVRNDANSADFSPPFSPPDPDKMSQSSSKRKRNSTYTFETQGEQPATNIEEEEPPSKRVRRATFSVSPKVTDKLDNEIDSVNSTEACATTGRSGEDNSQALDDIMDIHSEIMNLLDKRVEEKCKIPVNDFIIPYSGKFSRMRDFEVFRVLIFVDRARTRYCIQCGKGR